MDRSTAIAWMLSACAASLRQSQAKTLIALVRSAVGRSRISLAEIGRGLPRTARVKHRIKRTWRFLANDRIEPTLAMTGVVGRLLRRYRSRRPLLLSVDWTDIRSMQTLVVAANLKGRAFPLAWASCRKHVYDGHRSRNAFEESLLGMVRHMIPEHVKALILADRGFGRTELGRCCQRLGFHYIFRVQGKVMVRFDDQACRLDRYPVGRGQAHLLRNVLYRSHDPIRQHVFKLWRKGLPKDRDEPWYLMTSLDARGYTARRISQLYGRRMSIEQLFRDGKNKRNGWALRDTGLSDPQRLDRLILILALAYLLLMGVGLLAQRDYRPGDWSSNNRHDSASLFRIGQTMLDTIGLPKQLFQTLIQQLEREIPNWG